MGGAEARRDRNLVAWMKEEGMASEYMQNLDWENFFDLATVTQDKIDTIKGPLGDFFRTHTQSELFEEGIRRDIQLFPVSTAAYMLNDPQLKVRDYWDAVEHDELGTALTYPGSFMKANRSPIMKTVRAPLIGEHNEEILVNELGLSRKTITMYKGMGVI